MEAILNFDINMLNSIQETMRNPFLDKASVILSHVTTYGILWIVLGIILILFKKTRVTGITLILSLAFVFLTGDLLLKHVVQRPRPFTVNPAITLLIKAPSGASFPSTHSAMAAAVTTVFLMRKHVALGVTALILTVCIAFSRLYLYVHYPTDVLCGLLLGVIGGVLMVFLVKKFAKK